ncbi:casein kinase 2 regulatory subunit, variant 3 [Basidiobolus ranarum]|uniref:Casein kinase II subunit beta n=1 Tax=Basidiobolus ranarum TaxID=34480 RepID=A0ABR2VVN5_9FUNG
MNTNSESSKQLPSTYEEECYDETPMDCSSSDISHDSEIVSWITWFCSLSGNEYLVEVSEDFIEDDFNLTGLSSTVPFYREAIEMMLDIEPEDEQKDTDISVIESSAEQLYGLIHQRYILTRQGLDKMADKYERGEFGYCPRYYCNATPVVPCGRVDTLGTETVKLYCLNCMDIYSPPSSKFQHLDGGFFGTTFPHMFLLLLYPDAYRRYTNGTFVPKIHGFKIHESSKNGPKNAWLRIRPTPSDSGSSTDEDEEGDDDEEGNRWNDFDNKAMAGIEQQTLTEDVTNVDGKKDNINFSSHI